MLAGRAVVEWRLDWVLWGTMVVWWAWLELALLPSDVGRESEVFLDELRADNAEMREDVDN